MWRYLPTLPRRLSVFGLAVIACTATMAELIFVCRSLRSRMWRRRRIFARYRSQGRRSSSLESWNNLPSEWEGWAKEMFFVGSQRVHPADKLMTGHCLRCVLMLDILHGWLMLISTLVGTLMTGRSEVQSLGDPLLAATLVVSTINPN